MPGTPKQGCRLAAKDIFPYLHPELLSGLGSGVLNTEDNFHHSLFLHKGKQGDNLQIVNSFVKANDPFTLQLANPCMLTQGICPTHTVSLYKATPHPKEPGIY